MKLFNFFKKHVKSFEISEEKCQKAHHRGQELTNLLHPQITELLSKNYGKELSSSHFQSKKGDSKDVFEIATIGLSIINLIALVEQSNESLDTVKQCLKFYQEVYSGINNGYIYHQLMKYLQDYKNFTDSEATSKIKDQNTIRICFTGAWVIRYYLGEEATIQFDSSMEMGRMIHDTISNLWEPNKK